MVRSFKAVAVVLLVLAVFGGGCVWSVWPYRPVASFDLGDGYTLRLWTKYDHLDLDTRFPTLYYHVTMGTNEVVPTTFLGAIRGGVVPGDVREEDLSFKLRFANRGRLACVYEEHDAAKDAFFGVMFDLDSGESWPRHSHYDEASKPIPKERWLDRYLKLRHDNPAMPKVRGFEQED